MYGTYFYMRVRYQICGAGQIGGFGDDDSRKFAGQFSRDANWQWGHRRSWQFLWVMTLRFLSQCFRFSNTHRIWLYWRSHKRIYHLSCAGCPKMKMHNFNTIIFLKPKELKNEIWSKQWNTEFDETWLQIFIPITVRGAATARHAALTASGSQMSQLASNRFESPFSLVVFWGFMSYGLGDRGAIWWPQIAGFLIRIGFQKTRPTEHRHFWGHWLSSAARWVWIWLLCKIQDTNCKLSYSDWLVCKPLINYFTEGVSMQYLSLTIEERTPDWKCTCLDALGILLVKVCRDLFNFGFINQPPALILPGSLSQLLPFGLGF